MNISILLSALFLSVSALASSNAFAKSACIVLDQDDYQNSTLSRSAKRALKRRGYQITNDPQEANFRAGELCTSEGIDDYCQLVVANLSDKIKTSAEHREGRATLVEGLYREMFRIRDYSRIKSCAELTRYETQAE